MQLEVDIDEIVRQVMAQLRPGAPAAALALGDPNKLATSTTNKTQTHSLEITERLVTLATLENRLTGIRHVVLRRGAVVTPSARDLLRERGVAISYTSAANSASTVAIMLGVAELAEANGKPVAAPFLEALAVDRVNIERVAALGLASVISELADHAARGGRPTALLTSRPEAAACLANRVPGVRAVAARDPDSLRRAMHEVAANFLAFDPAPAPAAFRRLLGEFQAGWPRPVPPVFDVHFPRV